jgi:hypothetical protein
MQNTTQSLKMKVVSKVAMMYTERHRQTGCSCRCWPVSTGVHVDPPGFQCYTVLKQIIFSDEATFHVSGKFHSHSVRIWGTENTCVVMKRIGDSAKVKRVLWFNILKPSGYYMYHHF